MDRECTADRAEEVDTGAARRHHNVVRQIRDERHQRREPELLEEENLDQTRECGLRSTSPKDFQGFEPRAWANSARSRRRSAAITISTTAKTAIP